MPTRPGSDLISVRASTKEKLREIKGEGSFDEAIQALLAGAASSTTALERPRLPDEQIALADMAKTRWRLALQRGQLVEHGPRLIAYMTGMRERSKLRVRQA